MVTVNINENSKEAIALLEYLKSLSFVEVEEKPRYNATTEKAIKDAREGKTEEVSLESFRKMLYS